MDFEALEELVKNYEKKHQPALVKHILNTLKQHYNWEDVNDNLLYTKWFIKGVRLICNSIEKGLNLQHYNWKTSDFSNQDFNFFYNYAELGILNTEVVGVWEQYGRKAIKNMRGHLFTDKARFAKRLAELSPNIKDKYFWLDQGIVECTNGIMWSQEYDSQHHASQFCLRGDMEITLAEIVVDLELKLDLLEQAYQDYEKAWECFENLESRDPYVVGFKGFAAQKIAELTDDLNHKKVWLEIAIQTREECAKKLEKSEPAQASHQYGFKAQAERDLATISSEQEAINLLDQAYSNYSIAIDLANNTNRLHEAHIYSFRADTARRRAELTHDLKQRLSWKKQEYSDNYQGATKVKPFNEEHSAITFVNAGRAAAEIFEIDGTHLDEAIACYSAFINYFQQHTFTEYYALFNAISKKVLPDLEMKKNPQKKESWKRDRRKKHKYRTGNF